MPRAPHLWTGRLRSGGLRGVWPPCTVSNEYHYKQSADIVKSDAKCSIIDLDDKQRFIEVDHEHINFELDQ